MPQLMNLSIIVPVGRPDTARQTISSILEQKDLPSDTQIILVGAGLDSMQDSIRDIRVLFVPLQERLNPAETRMAGISKASGSWYLFVDDDIELDVSFTEILRPLLEPGRKMGAIGARLPGKEHKYFSRVTDLANFWSQQSDVSGEREWLYSAVLAVPASVYHAVGGFNPDLAIGEDIDLTRRIGQAGYTVFYCAALVGHHNHRRVRFSSSASYFWRNGGLAKYQFHKDGVLRVWNTARIATILFASIRNTVQQNRGKVRGFYFYLPSVALMYCIYSLSMEVHYHRYKRMFLKENLSVDLLKEYMTLNRLYKRSLAAEIEGQHLISRFMLVAAFLRENSTTVFFLALLLFVFSAS